MMTETQETVPPQVLDAAETEADHAVHEETPIDEALLQSEEQPPSWFLSFAQELSQNVDVADLRAYIQKVEGLSLQDLNELIGGNFAELPYSFMRKVLPDGSDDEQVANIFRTKREAYLVDHPEDKQGGNAAEGVVGQDGRFMQIDDWNTLTPADRFIWLVGPTCFHYNTDVPGYGSEPSERSKI